MGALKINYWILLVNEFSVWAQTTARDEAGNLTTVVKLVSRPINRATCCHVIHCICRPTADSLDLMHHMVLTSVRLMLNLALTLTNCRHNFNYKYNPKPNPIYYSELSLELLARLKTTRISIGIWLNALRYASLSSIDFKHFKVQVNWRLHRVCKPHGFFRHFSTAITVRHTAPSISWRWVHVAVPAIA